MKRKTQKQIDESPQKEKAQLQNEKTHQQIDEKQQTDKTQ